MMLQPIGTTVNQCHDIQVSFLEEFLSDNKRSQFKKRDELMLVLLAYVWI